MPLLFPIRFALSVTAVSICAAPLLAVDHFVVRRDGRELHFSGKVLVTAEDGGLMAVAPDGVIWAVQPAELVSRTSDREPFEPLSAQKLGQQLRGQLGDQFEVYSTARYTICHNTSRQYAAWCGGLLERLNRAFNNFWQRRGFALREPEFPLVAIVFSDKESYVRHSRAELGQAVDSMIGYYSLQTNRVTMYDLTGVQALRRPGDRRGTSAEINVMLSRPEAEASVATIVHEATHQLAYNSGLHARFADVPLWVSEGLAMYFETPDLQSSSGWRGVGEVNPARLTRFREFLPTRPRGSLLALASDDKRMRDARGSLDAYAEAWALTYYLMRQHPKRYLAYLKSLSQKQPMVWDDPTERLQELRAAFGSDWDKLDADLVRLMQKVR